MELNIFFKIRATSCRFDPLMSDIYPWFRQSDVSKADKQLTGKMQYDFTKTKTFKGRANLL